MNKNRNNKKRAYLNTILWTLFIIAVPNIIGFSFQGLKLFSSFSHYISFTSLGYAYGFVFSWGNKLIGAYTEKLNWTKNPKKANVISFLLLIGYGITMSIMIPYIYDRIVWGMSGKDVFYDVSAKAFITIVGDLIVIYFYYSNYITNHWIKAIEKNEELKRENLLAKYEALKNQVNPHFLFNSLNTLSGVVEQKPELATRFIKKLSDIYRYVLEQSDKELVSIDNEMKFVEDYIYLSRMRFGEALIFNANITMNDSFQVVPLGIQSLVENAVKHNIISDDNPLKVEISIEDDYVVIKNNIQQKNIIVADKEPMGLDNLKKRCSYHAASPLEIIQSEHEFKVKLPIIKSQ